MGTINESSVRSVEELSEDGIEAAVGHLRAYVDLRKAYARPSEALDYVVAYLEANMDDLKEAASFDEEQ